MHRIIGALSIVLVAMGMNGPVRAQQADAVQSYPWPTSQADEWVASSINDQPDDEGVPDGTVVLRFKGDAASRYYYLELRRDSSLRDDTGHLLARLPGIPYFAARRSPQRLVFYFLAPFPRKIARYDLIVVEKAVAHRWTCMIGQPLIAHLGTIPHPYDRDERADLDDALIKTLGAEEPAFARDGCVAVKAGADRSVSVRPVLRVPFPKVGEAFNADQRGLRGGWLYQGLMICNERSGNDCQVIQYLGDGRTAFIVQVASGRGRQRQYRVTQIFYADPQRVHEQECKIGQDYPVAGISNADGRGGEIVFTNGRRIWSVHWSGALPRTCKPING